ncbi:MAG: mechanosensitive ion channel [Planctomycetes bacterium]|nr:mechanosensitive ion channel [Planctomycetota bacterium]
MERHRFRSLVFVIVCALACTAGMVIDRALPDMHRLSSGLSWPGLAGVIAGIMALCGLFTLGTHLYLARKGQPPVEGVMIGRLYWLLGFVAVLVSIVYGFGALGTMGTALGAFGGMLLGWSLQAPVSGFAAWILVSIKRPFRPGDRVQFPSLGLTGDIMEIGPMYTVLNQVGGSIASEEAVGRHILVPNAMLFGQVVINYTVSQGAAYMLDEVVVRITYDSDWRKAEEILLKAANTVVSDVMAVTGNKPYIRADLYDYGVYLRLRYETRVKDRVETSYEINKLIFGEFQRTPTVDIAIPFVYSYRAGQDRKTEEPPPDQEADKIVEVDISRVLPGQIPLDTQDIELLARSIKAEGLLQPIVVVRKAGTDDYEILAGHLRFEACKRLGWKKVPAVLRNND